MKTNIFVQGHLMFDELLKLYRNFLFPLNQSFFEKQGKSVTSFHVSVAYKMFYFINLDMLFAVFDELFL